MCLPQIGAIIKDAASWSQGIKCSIGYVARSYEFFYTLILCVVFFGDTLIIFEGMP